MNTNSSFIPITEQEIDYDLIKEQIKVAAGIKISGEHCTQNFTLSSAELIPKILIFQFQAVARKITNLHLELDME